VARAALAWAYQSGLPFATLAGDGEQVLHHEGGAGKQALFPAGKRLLQSMGNEGVCFVFRQKGCHRGLL
jgi:hypothetical protein